MLAFMIRTVIIYFILILSVRLMGKRQIGELQPSELVITILMSEIASMPLQDSDSPLLLSLVGIFLLASLEVAFSCAAMKSEKLRELIQGHSVMIIRNGEIQQENLKLLRFTIDDLMESLRMKDVFDVSDVEFAYVETNGSVSVSLKSEKAPLTAGDMDIKKEKTPLACLVISDGKVVDREFHLCGMTDESLEKILKKEG